MLEDSAEGTRWKVVKIGDPRGEISWRLLTIPIESTLHFLAATFSPTDIVSLR